MVQKSKVTGKYYTVETLSLEDKIRLGFDKSVIDDLKKVNEKQKKSPVKSTKKGKLKEGGI